MADGGRPFRAVVCALVLCAAALGGCGTDDEPSLPGDASVVASSGDPETVTGDLGGVELFPGSEPVGSRSEEDGVVTQSFVAPAAAPAEVMSHFQNFVGEPTGPVEDVGTALRAEFRTDDGRRLEVSVTDLGADEQDQVQYSLVLHPR